MARGDVRIAVTLACEECKRRNYQTNKSKRNNPDRITLRKYCKWCRRHTGPPPRPRTQRARDIGLDDASVEDAGLGGSTPAPDPLEHSSADVDEALLAETGEAGFETDDRAPDIVAEEQEIEREEARH